jgi:hypothetical protein
MLINAAAGPGVLMGTVGGRGGTWGDNETRRRVTLHLDLSEGGS